MGFFFKKKEGQPTQLSFVTNLISYLSNEQKIFFVTKKSAVIIHQASHPFYGVNTFFGANFSHSFNSYHIREIIYVEKHYYLIT